jgi:hypothetical protein
MQSTAARADGFLKGGIEAMRLQSRVAVLLTLVLAGMRWPRHTSCRIHQSNQA